MQSQERKKQILKLQISIISKPIASKVLKQSWGIEKQFLWKLLQNCKLKKFIAHSIFWVRKCATHQHNHKKNHTFQNLKFFIWVSIHTVISCWNCCPNTPFLHRSPKFVTSSLLQNTKRATYQSLCLKKYTLQSQEKLKLKKFDEEMEYERRVVEECVECLEWAP